MEKLKLAIPEALKRTVAETTPGDLPGSCSSLLDFLLHFPPFHQMVEDLAVSERALCGKNKDEALQWKERGNLCFASKDYASALDSYSQALRVAPMDADNMEKNLVATLYLNRAFALYAWYRRGKANASLENYKDAFNDLNVAKTVELSSEVKSQIEGELKTLSNQCGSTSPRLQHTAAKLNISDELDDTKLQCVNTPDKGRGMASTNNIPPGSLVHTEEPFAVVILKSCRGTHCHYCLNELPADKVPCTSCSIPFYCSLNCQIRAGGKLLSYPKSYGSPKYLSNGLEKYVAEIILGSDPETDSEHIPEHRHECQGVSWPSVLPSEIVLAGRAFVKSIIQRRGSLESSNLTEILDLSHHYSQLSPESKLELHIYSIVLLCCLLRSSDLDIQLNGLSIAQVVILISQIRVNSMAVTRTKSSDVHSIVDKFGKLSGSMITDNVEQVKVGQAIYKVGSLFNHSCQPNIHAYFLSRTLFIRTTEVVAAGCPLELSYGPQVGQWDCKDRVKFLEDEYSFRCIVLDSSTLDCEKHKIEQLRSMPGTSILEPYFQVEDISNNYTNEVLDAYLDRSRLCNGNPGYCLKCGSYRDLETSFAAVNKAWKCISRLQDGIVAKEISRSQLSDALRSLDLLKSTLHAYNRRIAEVEDILALAFCVVGDLQRAKYHCLASIEILEKLYNSHHVVIGHELVKISSIQLSLNESDVDSSFSRMKDIFKCYYGQETYEIFPHI
ncbi:hypothetical protein TIFTF001_010314 [Ficus carica]|uniref:SET domain-containing protein n=1 Tax=Ficus carica TaxID=3494 RepID=A0AA88D3C3_FICCA|nr:hypothetical protein TIFTF001_010314 [Ficus carica]